MTICCKPPASCYMKRHDMKHSYLSVFLFSSDSMLASEHAVSNENEVQEFEAVSQCHLHVPKKAPGLDY